MQSWTLGILCFNEAGTIAQVIVKAHANATKMAETNFEIIVVDDGSTDGSVQIIEKIALDLTNIKPIIKAVNQGIGPGLRSVYTNATKENVIVFSGDGQYNSDELCNYASFTDTQFLAFYRKENAVYSGPRVLLSFINKLFNKVILSLNLKDVNWAKAYKTKVVQALNLKTTSSIIESEICAKLTLLGLKPIEIPSVYYARTYGESKGSSWRIIRKVMLEMITLTVVITKFRLNGKSR